MSAASSELKSESATEARGDEPGGGQRGEPTPRTVNKKPLVPALTPLLVGVAGMAVVDALASSWAAGATMGDRLLLAIRVFLYVIPFYLVAALCIAMLLSLIPELGRRALAAGLPRLEHAVARDIIASLLPPAAALFSLLVLVGEIAASRFHNHALGSLVVACIVAVAVVGAVIVWLAYFLILRRLRERFAGRARCSAALRWGLSSAPVALAVVWLVGANWQGFRALGLSLLVGPVVGACSGVVFAVLRWSRRPTRRRLGLFLVWSTFLLSMVAAFAVGSIFPDTAVRVIHAGRWSAHLLRGGQALTDIDGDGVSSMFGGGDCAPFDPTVHPLALDVVGDGIDNNCLNGDARPASRPAAPMWIDEFSSKGKCRNLVLITIEALRADHVSFLGYGRPTTPRLAALAEESVVFRRMYAASSATPLSLAALFSTRPPSRIKVRPGRIHPGVDPVTPWFPQILQQSGFATAAVVGDFEVFDPRTFNVGFDRGFDNFDTSTVIGKERGFFRGFPSEALIDRATQWLDGQGQRRTFLWLHLYEPHALYEQPPGAPDFGSDRQGRYDAEIWEADRQVGRLFHYLDERGKKADTVVVVVGDHAEAFGEHGPEYHASTLFDSQVWTMGVMYVPGLGHRTVEQPVVNYDLGTTVMNLLGVRLRFDELRGRNLVPALRGQNVEPSAVFVELAGFKFSRPMFGMVDWPYKLLHMAGTPSFYLYDLERDPAERVDVKSAHPEVFARMKSTMVEHIEGAAP
jgi:arylsulfatase A-like enzyme